MVLDAKKVVYVGPDGAGESQVIGAYIHHTLYPKIAVVARVN